MVGDEDVTPTGGEVLNAVGAVADAHVAKGGVVESVSAEMAEVTEDIVDQVLVDDAFQVADDEAGDHPADLRVLVVEDLLNVNLERGIGLCHGSPSGG